MHLMQRVRLEVQRGLSKSYFVNRHRRILFELNEELLEVCPDQEEMNTTYHQYLPEFCDLSVEFQEDPWLSPEEKQALSAEELWENLAAWLEMAEEHDHRMVDFVCESVDDPELSLFY